MFSGWYFCGGGCDMGRRLGWKQGKSKYKGVGWDKDKQKWRASIYIDNKLKHLSRFETEKEAAAAYDAATKEYRGEYAYLNFGLHL